MSAISSARLRRARRCGYGRGYPRRLRAGCCLPLHHHRQAVADQQGVDAGHIEDAREGGNRRRSASRWADRADFIAARSVIRTFFS